jgi:hypothetical protein
MTTDRFQEQQHCPNQQTMVAYQVPKNYEIVIVTIGLTNEKIQSKNF